MTMTDREVVPPLDWEVRGNVIREVTCVFLIMSYKSYCTVSKLLRLVFTQHNALKVFQIIIIYYFTYEIYFKELKRHLVYYIHTNICHVCCCSFLQLPLVSVSSH